MKVFGVSVHFLTICLLICLQNISHAEEPLPYGDVNFATSCSSDSTQDFNTAVSLVYSFWYDESLKAFDTLIAHEPTCCMAYWGAAMTFNHPIWDFIPDDRLALAEKYSASATACAEQNKVTDRELGYLAALSVYMNTTDPVVKEPSARLQAYADTFKSRVYEPYGATDENAGVLYGLALLGVGYYSEDEPGSGYPNLKMAGLIEEMMTLVNENSPGALHYVIHSYDSPLMAQRALDAAYKYQEVSVAVPHALHMPSHIFGDLGLWSDMIISNQRALNQATVNSPGVPTGDWYHGSYFMEFGMLQLAMDCDAKSFMEVFQDLSATNTDTFLSEGAIRVPSMYLIETRSWEDAASFDLSTFYPAVPTEMWEEHAWTLINANFVATLGRAILDYPPEEITAAVNAVDAANATLYSDSDWQVHKLPNMRNFFDACVNSAHAWQTFRLDSFTAGIEAMESIVVQQEMGWAPEVAAAWDAHEQIAEMYLIRGQPGDVEKALSAYEIAVETYPNRYRSNAGAAKCADMLSIDVKASKYYGNVRSNFHCILLYFLFCI